MDKRDKIVVAAGVVIVIIALIGVVYQEEDVSSAETMEKQYAFNVNWDKKTVTLPGEGQVSTGGTSTENFSISHRGLGTVTVTLDWSDDWATGFIIPWNWSDMLSLQVSAPSGVSFSGSSSASGYSGPQTVMATIGDKPESVQLNASNMSAAEEMVEDRYMSSTGTGDWTATVGIDTKPFLLDRGNEYTVTLEYTYYEYSIKKVEVS